MRQLQYHSANSLIWVDVPAPEIQDNRDAIVKPLMVSRCELDRSIAGGMLGWPGGFAFGHEIYAEVVDAGDGVARYKPGDRVVVPFQISCGACGRCRAGFTGLCETVPYRSSYGMAPLSGVDYGGGLSDRVRVPFADHMLVAAPDNMEPAAIAGVADNVTSAYAMVAEPLAMFPNARVLIVGGNTVALNAARFALGLGADKVVLVDEDAESLKIAAQFGAEAVHASIEPQMQSVGQFPVTIDATGTEDGLAFAVYSTDHEGFCQTAYGGFSEKTPVPLRHMYGTNITLKIARVHARAHMPEVLALLHKGCVHGEPLVSRQVPFSEAADAMLEPAHGMVFFPD